MRWFLWHHAYAIERASVEFSFFLEVSYGVAFMFFWARSCKVNTKDDFSPIQTLWNGLLVGYKCWRYRRPSAEIER
jgi:hypothetical protein